MCHAPPKVAAVEPIGTIARERPENHRSSPMFPGRSPLLNRSAPWRMDVIIGVDENANMPNRRDWADAIGRATFSERNAGRIVYLAIDEEEIDSIGADSFGLDPIASRESFWASVIEVVRQGWPLSLGSGKYPRNLHCLAAQVVAAFQMSDKAYWRRLRECLGQSSEDKLPKGLNGEQHAELWAALKRWANEKNEGRLGLVQLVGKEEGHRFVAEPLGQCLLRRTDFKRLRRLFFERRRLDPGVQLLQQLKGMVEEAWGWPPGRYVTTHCGRVLEDHRSEAAWEQIEAEYRRFLEEGCSEAAPPSRPPTSVIRNQTPKTIVLLQIGRRRLVGGLYERNEGPLTSLIANLGAVLWRCYLRAGRPASNPPHVPPHDHCVLAVRRDETGAFAERRQCRAGDEVLLLVPVLHGQAWLDNADFGLFLEVPQLYQSTTGPDRPAWVPLEGIPEGWCALRFRTREVLSGVNLKGHWIGKVNRSATGLRASGGLILRRGVWMLGAGPTIQVVGPKRPDHVLIDGERHWLDASRCVTPDLLQGEHVVRLPGRNLKPLRFRVSEPELTVPAGLEGWHRVEGGWPASVGETRRIGVASGGATLHGARMHGDWPPRPEPELEPEPTNIAPPATTPNPALPDELAALILAVGLRLDGRRLPLDPRLLKGARAAAESGLANPLLRGLIRVGRPGP